MTSMTERKCACCGGGFSARTADVERGWAKFCSKSCKAKKQEARTHQNRDFHHRREVVGESPIAVGFDEAYEFGEGPEWDAHKDY